MEVRKSHARFRQPAVDVKQPFVVVRGLFLEVRQFFVEVIKVGCLSSPASCRCEIANGPKYS